MIDCRSDTYLLLVESMISGYASSVCDAIVLCPVESHVPSQRRNPNTVTFMKRFFYIIEERKGEGVERLIADHSKRSLYELIHYIELTWEIAKFKTSVYSASFSYDC